MAKGAGITRSVPPHKWRHFLFTWLKKQGLVALPLIVCSKYHRLAVYNYASIEVKNLARHVGRVVRGQEHIGRCKLIRLTWPLQLTSLPVSPRRVVLVVRRYALIRSA